MSYIYTGRGNLEITMSMAQPELPEFEKPPLIEVVMSVQFETPEKYNNIYARDVWAFFEKDFPTIEEHPELAPSFELYGGMINPQAHIELLSGPFGSRYWFVKKDDTQLIQFQKDRFLHNWRRLVDGSNSYPRFEKIFSDYSQELAALEAFYQEKGWGKLKINQCEVTYINHIDLQDENRDIVHVFKTIDLPFIQGQVDYSLNYRKVIHSDDKKPICRLYVKADTASKADRKPLILLNLTTKGAPLTTEISSALTLIRKMREEIVLGFTEITSDEMHKIWKRKK